MVSLTEVQHIFLTTFLICEFAVHFPQTESIKNVAIVFYRKFADFYFASDSK